MPSLVQKALLLGLLGGNAAPSAPSGLAYTGASGGVVFTQTPILTWNAVGGAASYTVQYDHDGTFVSPTVVTGVLTPSYTFPSQTAGAFLYARVYAVNPAGTSPASAVAACVVPIVYDTFTGTDATNLIAHASNIPGSIVWSKASFDGTTPADTNAVLDVNTLKLVASNKGAIVNLGAADNTVEMDWNTSASPTNYAGFMVRYQDNSNLYIVMFNASSSFIRLSQILAGATTTVKQVSSVTITEGQTHHLKAVVAGSSVLAYVDGVLKATFSSADGSQMTNFLTSTKTGITVTSVNTVERWDNYVAYPGLPP